LIDPANRVTPSTELPTRDHSRLDSEGNADSRSGGAKITSETLGLSTS
jgi:hypothetical protein